MLAILLFGFASGLPFQLTGSTVQAWFTVYNVSTITIGFMGLVGLPYVFKFLWAPLLDRYIPPFLGRRRGWMLIMQGLLSLCLVVTAFLRPDINPWLIGFITLLLAIFSASQDIVIDAYRTDVMRPTERGLSVSLTIGAYRIAMIVSGALALILADKIGWQLTYLIMAGVMFSCSLISLFSPEPEQRLHAPLSLSEAVVQPFNEFILRDKALLILLLLATYKIGDAFISSLSTTFLLRGVHFTLTEVGAYNKLFGFASNIAGAFVGGIFLTRLSLYRGLLVFGFLQALSNLLFLILAIVGKNYVLMGAAVMGENFFGGLGSAAFLSLMMALCDKRYSATQYALFSALFALVRTLISPLSGYIETYFGWPFFFGLSFVVSFPALYILYLLKPQINHYGVAD